MMKRFNDLGFQKKLLISYLLLVLLPIFCIVIFVLEDMTSSLKETEKENVMNSFQQSLLTVNNYFESYIDLAKSLQTDSDLTTFLNKSYPAGTAYQNKYADGMAIRALYKARLIYESLDGDLFSIKTNNRNIICTDSPFFYFSASDLRADWYLESLKNPDLFVVSAPTTSMGYKMIPISACLTSKRGFENMFLIEANASNLCSLLTTENSGHEFLILNQDQIILAAHDYNLIGVPLRDTAYAALAERVQSAEKPLLNEEEGKLVVMGKICPDTALSGCRLISLSPSTPQDQLIIKSLSRSAPLWALVLLMDIIMILLFSRSLTGRISRLVHSVRNVSLDGDSDAICLEGKDEIAELSRHIKGMVDRIHALIQNVYESDLQAKSAEIRALQSQINPHFLFNSLQAINTSALKSGALDTSDMIVNYSRLIRRSIEWKSGVIPLREELDLIRDYLRIQKERFADRFTYSLEVEEKYLSLSVPKFCLQPLVENAVIHGGSGGQKHYDIRLFTGEEPGALLLTVEDTGAGIPAEKEAHVQALLEADTLPPQDAHIGILNVHHRLRLLYGAGYGVTLRSSPGQGTSVTVRLPPPTA